MQFKVQAHRGASGHAPENTIPAFLLARRMGADGIECDIHLSADGEFMVCHDETVNRTSNGHGKISEMTVPELKKLDFGSWYGAEYANTRIPTLDEMLDVVSCMEIINIEVKSFGEDSTDAIDRFYAILSGRNVLKKVIISSFHIELLREMKERHPDFYTAFLYEGKREAGILLAKEYLCDAIHPYKGDVDENLISLAREKELGINVWTLNEEEEIEHIGQLGVTGVITNYPDIALKVREGKG
jgi:glycerophosphoryl diester phosphodiesterase